VVAVISARLIIVTAIAGMVLNGCGLFPEATFTLSPTSRLPSWFKLPPGYSRADVTVTMSYFVLPNGPIARLKMSSTRGETISSLTGTLRGLKPTVLPGAHNGYPGYEVISVNGMVEVVEHRAMEPIFYVTDDIDVRKALGVTTSNNRFERSRVASSVSEGGSR
jgi:hypothetical protein